MSEVLRHPAKLHRFLVLRRLDRDRCQGLLLTASGKMEARTEIGGEWAVRPALTNRFRGLPFQPDPELARHRDEWNRVVREERGAGERAA